MSQYYNVVPWFDSKEWLNVYSKICADPPSKAGKNNALNLLKIWKVRCPSLPSGIESTLSLLDVQLEDLKVNRTGNNQDAVLRLAYSSAIMRFVNHMLDTETAKGVSLYHAAKNLEVPDWVIDLRHDAAHSNNLPSLELLREAADISFQWLQVNYWEKHKEHIQDYVISSLPVNDSKDAKLTLILNLCMSLSICAHSQCKIKNLADITDVGMQESVLHDIKELFGETVNLTNLKTTSVTALISLLNKQCRSLLDSKDRSAIVSQVFLGEDSLLLSLELVEELSQRDFHLNNTLSKSFLQCFELLLTFLHTHDLILNFVLDLIRLTQNETNGENKCKLAALWVSEILKALKRSHDFLDVSTLKSSEVSKKIKRKLFKQCFPHYNMGTCSLLLDLGCDVPRELTSIHYIQPTISTYNTNLTYFIKDLLNLVQPKLPRPTVDNICSLADLISAPSKFPASSNRLYSVQDLCKEQDSMAKDGSSDSDCVEVTDMDTNKESPVQEDKSCVWELASPSHDWSACPIGILPWQLSTGMEVDL